MFLFIKEFYKFLSTGSLSSDLSYSNKNFYTNAYVLKGFVYYIIALFCLLVLNHKIRNESSVLDGDNFFVTFINVVVIAPILEEVLFRYHTKIQFKNIVFSTIIAIFLFHDSLNLLFIFVLYFVILFIFLKYKLKIDKLILVYFSALMFGLSHLIFVEYSFMSENYKSSFFIFSTRFFSGLLFCFVFYKKGILASIIFHSIWNFGPFLVIFFSRRVLEL